MTAASSTAPLTQWSTVQETLIPLGNGYRAKAPQARFVLMQYGSLINSILAPLFSPFSPSFFQSQIPPPSQEQILSLLEKEITSLRYNLASPEKIASLQEFLKADLKKLQALIEQAIAIARTFFQNFKIPEKIDLQTLDSWNFAYKAVGLKQSEQPVSFSDNDLKAFGVKKEEVTTSPTLLSCLQFTLLKIREQRAKNWIFQEECYQDDMLHNIDATLKKWDYKIVDAPKPNDLVVYFEGDRGVHIGHFIFCEEDPKRCVESKIGFLNRYSHRHRIFALPHYLGDRVAFYRASR